MRTRKTIVVLISGKAGSGKSTAGDLFTKKLSFIPDMEVFRYAFAGPLKKIARNEMKWNEQKDEKGRRLLQELGRVGREYNENLWVSKLMDEIDDSPNLLPPNFVVVDDWRFPNELAYLQNQPLLEVVTVRVVGQHSQLPGNTGSDISENSLPNTPESYNYFINNTGDLSFLESQVDGVITQISQQFILE